MWHSTSWQGTAARQLTTGWQIYPRPAAVIYPHTRALTHGRRRHSRGCAQSCVSVGLVWLFGTIIKPRMNVGLPMADQRHPPPLQQVRYCCHQMQRGVRHFPFVSHPVFRPLMKRVGIVSVSVKEEKSVYKYRLKMTYSV